MQGRERPMNVVALLRETFIALNDLVVARLAERGHGVVRPAHPARSSSTSTTPAPRSACSPNGRR